jgi:hypothetical protein
MQLKTIKEVRVEDNEVGIPGARSGDATKV